MNQMVTHSEQLQFSSVQFSRSGVSDSLQPHECLPVHRQLPGPTQTMSIESVMTSNNFVLSHPLLLLPSIFASIRIFYKELAFPNRWPNIGVSASDLLMNIQDWFPLGLTALISLHSRGLPRVFSNTTVQKHQFFGHLMWRSPSLWSNSHICIWLLVKP